VCAISEKDCAMGQRCNTALNPPRCEMIYCGALGSACVDDRNTGDDDDLCQSRLCLGGVCVAPVDMAPDMTGVSSSLVTIPKTGTYTGLKQDPGLDSLLNCPDYSTDPSMSVEPNDSPDHASYAGMIKPDAPTLKITSVAICPKGASPLTGAHDVDYYKVDLTNVGPVSSLMAEVFYQVSHGDIDVAVLDKTGNIIASDGSAVDNGCASASVKNDVYYVAVAGANNLDSNVYQLGIRSFSLPKSCDATVSTSADMGPSLPDFSIPCKPTGHTCSISAECCGLFCDFDNTCS
jgi:hypothetical protein